MTSLSTTAIQRLRTELLNLEKDPPPFCKLYLVSKDNLFHWKAVLYGPKDSPYEQGSFTLDIELPKEYPTYPPVIKFETPIYHPNIRTTGGVCLDSFGYAWNPKYTLSKALLCVHLLLTKPNFDSPERREISKSDFFTRAREETKKHAMNK